MRRGGLRIPLGRTRAFWYIKSQCSSLLPTVPENGPQNDSQDAEYDKEKPKQCGHTSLF